MSMEASCDMARSCRLFEFVVCTVIIGMICAFGIVGNLISFWVLSRHPKKTSIVLLFKSLAVSDTTLLLTSLVVYTLPAIYPYTQTVKFVHDSWDFIRMYVWPFAMIAHTGTIWLTVLLTYERSRIICSSALISNNHRKPVKFMVAAIFSFAILYNLPRFFEHQIIDAGGNMTSPNTTHTYTNLGDVKLYQIIYSNLMYFPVMYIIPLSVVAFFNTRLVKSLKVSRYINERCGDHRGKKDSISICVVALVSVFFFCQTPALINQIFWAALGDEQRQCGGFHFYYTKVSDILVVLNSSCNFVIYCLFGKHFRRMFAQVLCKRRACHQRDSSHEKFEL